MSVFAGGLRPWKRQTEAKRAVDTTVPSKGELVVSDAGRAYVPDGATQAKDLSPLLTKQQADAAYPTLDSASMVPSPKVRRPISAFIKPASSIQHPTATLTINTTAPSYASQAYYTPANMPTRFRQEGTFIDRGDGALINVSNGVPATRDTDGAATGGARIAGFQMSWVIDTNFSIMVGTYGNHDFMILVDGQPVGASTWQHYNNTGEFKFMHVAFSDGVKPREVTYIGGQTAFVSVLAPGASACWRGKRAPLRAYLLGDSYGHGTGSTTEGAITAGTIGGCLVRQAGWSVVYGVQGGTGYMNPATGTNTGAEGPQGQRPYGHTRRVQAYQNYAQPIDLLIVLGGANDGDKTTYPQASVVAAAQAAWTALAAARPGVPILVVGVEAVYPAISADLNTLNSALKAAALAHPAVVGYVDLRTPLTIFGTGKLGTTAGDGNADYFISSDGVHPTHAGWEFITAEILRQASSMLIPAPSVAFAQ